MTKCVETQFYYIDSVYNSKNSPKVQYLACVPEDIFITM